MKLYNNPEKSLKAKITQGGEFVSDSSETSETDKYGIARSLGAKIKKSKKHIMDRAVFNKFGDLIGIRDENEEDRRK
ncbi:hypothetical protein HYV50_04660 [Candidatus Pacearchaeota archaeon]|nr:hypothetical protein [Candidatus Pacearchaeota archaeon]